MKVKLHLLTIAATLLFAATVHADPVGLTVIPNPATGTPGQTLTLSLAFTNSGPPQVQIISVLLSSTVGPGTAQLLMTPDPFVGRVLGFTDSVVAKVFSVTIFPSAKWGDEIVTTITVKYELLDGTRTEKSVTTTSNVKVVPEPTTMLLLGTGLAGVAIQIRTRFKKAKGRN